MKVWVMVDNIEDEGVYVPMAEPTEDIATAELKTYGAEIIYEENEHDEGLYDVLHDKSGMPLTDDGVMEAEIILDYAESQGWVKVFPHQIVILDQRAGGNTRNIQLFEVDMPWAVSKIA